MTLMKELFGKKGRSRMKRYICEGIVKGATHVRNQMPCQDNKKIIKISDEITIIALQMDMAVRNAREVTEAL